ncbi:glycosyltransferase [Roseococcus pinisoli]|uniref:Glycosyltransferase n=1 Tax=Roseococcus pinisoli TaxID=2835040 RepID=A0ABS5QE91_9PROT|nr:glycosyltransferase [Roseococcus pinisoli]MBS7812025.1 glycosyltransferase [Roseococcus pinisoli]
MTAERPGPRRVLHVLKYYRPAFTGEGVFLERSSAVMQEIEPGIAHDLLVTHTPQPAQEMAACSTLERVIYLSSKPVGTWRRQTALAAWFLRNLHRYDTVHFRTHADWYFVSYALARLMRRRLVLSATLDDSLPVLVGQYRSSLRRLATAGFRLFDAFVSISPKLMNETKGLADPERCHLVPCGITIPETAPGTRARLRLRLGIGAEDPVLLFVGGLCARKDPLFLVEAMPRILASHPRAHLVLVGPVLEPDHLHALTGAARMAGIEERVHLAGEQADPHPWFAASDLLVFASHLEGFGTVVPEAMAHGLPVVVRRLPQVNDGFVIEGRTGFLFDDADRYVAAVDGLLRDTAARARIGAAAKQLATERFGMGNVAATYLRIYGARAPAASHLEQRKATGLGSGASIFDTRFHSPAPVARDARPLLVTMVDAEEAFDWSAPFRRDATDVTSMGMQWRAHRIFERHGVVPLYLTDYPVAAQDAGREPLQDLLRDGACEIGAQLHPWVTPPFDEPLGERNSYAGNLPVELELAKARRLTQVLGDTFGEAPRIFRTGRFGAGPRTGDILKSLGYAADSSVTPCWPPEGVMRPWLSARPYWADREKTLMEIPVSAALVGRLSQATRVAPLVLHPRMQRMHVSGAMSRLGLMERIRLSPEGMTIDEARRLTRHMLAEGHRVFVVTYHTPSLVPGNTPYVRSAEDLTRFLVWLDEFYSFFSGEVGGRFGSWRDVRFGEAARVPMAAQ